MTRLGRSMGLFKVALTETATLGAGAGVGTDVVESGSVASGGETCVAGTGAAAPHADIPAISTTNADGAIDRSHF